MVSRERRRCQVQPARAGQGAGDELAGVFGPAGDLDRRAGGRAAADAAQHAPFPGQQGGRLQGGVLGLDDHLVDDLRVQDARE
jgi:hypothetical protein